MNSKRAKRLRQLVKHLQHKGVIEGGDWAIYGHQQHRSPNPSSIVGTGEEGNDQPKWIVQQTRMLDPACGKAIYKRMKTRAIATAPKA